MAGLPKSVGIIAFLAAATLAISLVSVSQDFDVPPLEIEPPGDVQTSSSPLQPVIDLIEANDEATEEQKAALIAAFEAADAEVVAPELALEMLAQVRWDTRTENIDSVIAAILNVLDRLTGEIIDDPLAALAEALNNALAPPGILNALGKAEVEDETLSQAAELVGSGLPPGILIRVVKGALRDEMPTEEIAVLLAELVAATEEGSWGQAANAVTGQGEFKHQDEEKNENRGVNEEPEEETNQHGSQGNTGKAKGRNE